MPRPGTGYLAVVRAVVTVAGVAVGFEVCDPACWPPVTALVAGCPTAEVPPVVTVSVGEGEIPAPTRPPDRSWSGMRLWFEPSGPVCTHPCGLRARTADGGVEVTGTPSGSDPAGAFRRVVQYPLVDVLAELGRHSLHAAVVARDRSLIVLGGAGAGKSTLAYAAHRRGWRVLTDDLAFVVDSGHGPRASGLPKALAVPADVVEPDDRPPRADPADPRGRVTLPVEIIEPGADLPVAAVVALGHGEGSARLEVMDDGAELLGMILASCPLAPVPRRLRGFFPLAGALSRLPGFTLLHGADPTRRVQQAGDLLDAAWAAAEGGGQ